MENKLITAVEWVLQYLNNVKSNEFCSIEKIKELLEQAKEMEKEQTLEFIRNAVRKILDEDRENPFNLEQYYNETFKSK